MCNQYFSSYIRWWDNLIARCFSKCDLAHCTSIRQFFRYNVEIIFGPAPWAPINLTFDITLLSNIFWKILTPEERYINFSPYRISNIFAFWSWAWLAGHLSPMFISSSDINFERVYMPSPTSSSLVWQFTWIEAYLPTFEVTMWSGVCLFAKMGVNDRIFLITVLLLSWSMMESRKACLLYST